MVRAAAYWQSDCLVEPAGRGCGTRPIRLHNGRRDENDPLAARVTVCPMTKKCAPKGYFAQEWHARHIIPVIRGMDAANRHRPRRPPPSTSTRVRTSQGPGPRSRRLPSHRQQAAASRSKRQQAAASGTATGYSTRSAPPTGKRWLVTTSLTACGLASIPAAKLPYLHQQRTFRCHPASLWTHARHVAHASEHSGASTGGNCAQRTRCAIFSRMANAKPAAPGTSSKRLQ